ncbi:MAG: KH domain-containing protein [Nitrososphaerota archaeon]
MPSWHIMVYSRDLLDIYSHPYAFHLFTSSKPSPSEAFKVAGEILSKAFPDWGKDEREYLAFVGYEGLPLSLPPEAEGMYVAAKFRAGLREDVQLVSTVPSMFASVISHYRSQQLTLDFDEKSDYARANVIDVVNALSEKSINFKVYETYRGYHIRAQLPSPLPLEEIIKLRRELGDDPSRLSVDSVYLKHGCGFLTNLLFNEKYWRDSDRTDLQRTTEVEIDLGSITVEYDWTISLILPSTSITTNKGTIKVEKKRVIFNGNFGMQEMQRIVKSIEDNFWEYSFYLKQEQDVKTKLLLAYGRISPFLSKVISKCEITVRPDTVTIHVPDSLSTHVGRLIGKQGVNIRTVESELGIRIKISQTSPPEDVEMKRRLQDLLRRVA